jgi:hypothetical protein
MGEYMLEYIHYMKEAKLCRYLIKEGGIEFERKHKEKFENAIRKKQEIELIFAHTIGKDAVSLLHSVKELPLRSFNKHGQKAPDGYQFNKLETAIEPMQ